MIKVEIEVSAERDLDKLAPSIALKVRGKLQTLESHPEPHKWLKKVEGATGNWYRLHVGRDWVAVGQLESTVFRVRMIEHRSKDYRSVKRR